VTEYAPDVFAFLRVLDGYDNLNLHKSFDAEANRDQVFNAGESVGQSGSFFFFSKDGKFLIKTLTETDFEAFMEMFRFYFRHVCHYPRSLLARCYGIYEVKMGEQKSVKIVVMGNTLQAR
jgi:1-phosphatidylinositol-4-phosphate 5-kinase